MSKFSSGRKPIKASQRILGAIVRELFPMIGVYEDFEPEDLGKKFTLDIFVPDKLLALEYHGEQHYQNIYWFGQQFIYSQVNSSLSI
jgi:hypothetical protein